MLQSKSHQLSFSFYQYPQNTLSKAVTFKTLTMRHADKLPRALTLDFSFIFYIISYKKPVHTCTPASSKGQRAKENLRLKNQRTICERRENGSGHASRHSTKTGTGGASKRPCAERARSDCHQARSRNPMLRSGTSVAHRAG